MSNEPDYGAECIKAYDEYAKKVFKQAGDPGMRRGDIAVFGCGDGDEYGHTEIITTRQARHYRRQTRMRRVRSFLARLADSVRGRK